MLLLFLFYVYCLHPYSLYSSLLLNCLCWNIAVVVGALLPPLIS